MTTNDLLWGILLVQMGQLIVLGVFAIWLIARLGPRP